MRNWRSVLVGLLALLICQLSLFQSPGATSQDAHQDKTQDQAKEGDKDKAGENDGKKTKDADKRRSDKPLVDTDKYKTPDDIRSRGPEDDRPSQEKGKDHATGAVPNPEKGAPLLTLTDIRRAMTPEWRKRYSDASTDSDRTRIIGQYLGFEEAPPTGENKK